MAERSFGPGPSRPVIRGLDGDRVLILENGQRTDDLSSQSGDHGVALSPLAAERVEIVRGPATLLYGANAIGGLVNVVSDIIPTRPVTRATGEAQAEFGTAAKEAGTAATSRSATGGWRCTAAAAAAARAMSVPAGDVANSQSRSGFGHVGGSFTASTGFVGASYQYNDSKYGSPHCRGGGHRAHPSPPRVHRARPVPRARRLRQRRARGLQRAPLSPRELDAGEVGTQFKNDTLDFELMATTRPLGGRLHGTYGVSGFDRSFEAIGDEALSPPVDQQTFGLFTYQEAVWPHVTLQFGARADWATFTPQENCRSVTSPTSPRRWARSSGRPIRRRSP